MENPIKMDDLGVPPFTETPKWSELFVKIPPWDAALNPFDSRIAHQGRPNENLQHVEVITGVSGEKARRNI